MSRRAVWLLGTVVALAAVALALAWQRSSDRELQRVLLGADRVCLRTGGTCHRNPGFERTLAEITQPDALRALATHLHVATLWPSPECKCCGNPTIEVYSGGQLVAELSVHHGKNLRWPGHWSCDVPLTAAAHEYMGDWFARLGFDPEGASGAELGVGPLRLLTWNVQKGEHGLDTLITELRQADADIVCLQEVTEPRGNATVPSQSEQMAKALGMYAYSHGDRLDDERNQALAILSRAPLVEKQALSAPDTTRNYAVTAVVPWRNVRLRVTCVHLAGTWTAQWEHVQETSAARLRDWTALRAAAGAWTGPTIVAGDFNTLPGASQFAELGNRLRIVSGTEPTFPSATPAMCLDYVLSSTELSCTKVTRLATTASDHQPVLVEFDLTDPATTKPTTQPRRAQREP